MRYEDSELSLIEIHHDAKGVRRFVDRTPDTGTGHAVNFSPAGDQLDSIDASSNRIGPSTAQFTLKAPGATPLPPIRTSGSKRKEGLSAHQKVWLYELDES